MNSSPRLCIGGLSRILTVLLALNLIFGAAFASEELPAPEQVKARMKANLPAIDRLKSAGKVGENNKAYLEARATLTEAEEKLLKTENEDRKTVYTLLAKRAATTIEKIQTARAAQIRERSTQGLWLEDPQGNWYRKPSGASR